jgi:hypothetical protein
VSSGTTYFQNIAGSLSIQGQISRLVGKSLAGNATLLSGNIFRITSKTLLASSTISASVGKFTSKGSFAGSIVATGVVMVGGTLSFTATGSITMTSILSDAVTYVRAYGSTITLSGNPFRLIAKSVGGVLALTGDAYKRMFVFIQSSISALGALATFKFTPGPGSILARGMRFMRKFIGRR